VCLLAAAPPHQLFVFNIQVGGHRMMAELGLNTRISLVGPRFIHSHHHTDLIKLSVVPALHCHLITLI
jgi:hypothetical protein